MARISKSKVHGESKGHATKSKPQAARSHARTTGAKPKHAASKTRAAKPRSRPVKSNVDKVPEKLETIPPGATREAFERDRPQHPAKPLRGDESAVGTPGGGTEVGGLAGTNIGDGSPENADLEQTMGSNVDEYDDDSSTPPYSGISGGAVGGTPAEGRSSGGRVHGGIRPGSVHRGDSTIGTDPESGAD